MESSQSGNGGYSSSFLKYIQPPKLPLKYRRSLNDLCYQSYYDDHGIPYHYQSGHKIEESDHKVIKKIRNFSENTTAHGVRRIFIARNTYTARLWLFGIILCFIILIVQAYQLVLKFNRYEKITSIELKFDYIQFPAVTFCNLNPYKKSLVRSVPSVKDTMDVYENAKSFRKGPAKQQQLPIGIIRKQSNKQNERLSHLFDSAMINDLNLNNHMRWENAKRRQRRHLKKNLFKNNHTSKIIHANANANEMFSLSDIYFITDSITTITTTTTTPTTIVTATANTATVETMRYEAVEAHCKCIGKAEMECIRFESVPPSDKNKCICTYDNEMNTAWPCFNISIWYEEECSACFEEGFCMPKQDYSIPSANWPCLCRNRTVDSLKYEKKM
uniref:Uncharacterized protein n=1 Tax=Elaeophora elaphi TaxID=1147741 RepID=A0A0R3S766_9BILA